MPRYGCPCTKCEQHGRTWVSTTKLGRHQEAEQYKQWCRSIGAFSSVPPNFIVDSPVADPFTLPSSGNDSTDPLSPEPTFPIALDPAPVVSSDTLKPARKKKVERRFICERINPETEKPCGDDHPGYAQKQGLIDHWVLQHGDQSKATCQYCGKDLKTPEKLSRHVPKEHPERCFRCLYAGCKVFTKQDATMRVHIVSKHDVEAHLIESYLAQPEIAPSDASQPLQDLSTPASAESSPNSSYTSAALPTTPEMLVHPSTSFSAAMKAWRSGVPILSHPYAPSTPPRTTSDDLTGELYISAQSSPLPGQESLWAPEVLPAVSMGDIQVPQDLFIPFSGDSTAIASEATDFPISSFEIEFLNRLLSTQNTLPLPQLWTSFSSSTFSSEASAPASTMTGPPLKQEGMVEDFSIFVPQYTMNEPSHPTLFDPTGPPIPSQLAVPFMDSSLQAFSSVATLSNLPPVSQPGSSDWYPMQCSMHSEQPADQHEYRIPPLGSWMQPPVLHAPVARHIPQRFTEIVNSLEFSSSA